MIAILYCDVRITVQYLTFPVMMPVYLIKVITNGKHNTPVIQGGPSTRWLFVKVIIDCGTDEEIIKNLISDQQIIFRPESAPDYFKPVTEVCVFT